MRTRRQHPHKNADGQDASPRMLLHCGGTCNPIVVSHRELAAAMECDPSLIGPLLKKLAAAGWIDYVPGSGRQSSIIRRRSVEELESGKYEDELGE